MNHGWMRKAGVVLVAGILAATGLAQAPAREEAMKSPEPGYAWRALDDNHIKAQLKQLAPFVLRYDTSALTGGERKLLERIPEVGRFIDAVFLEQSYPFGNAVFNELKAQYQREATPANRRLLEYFWISKGPFDAFDHQPFMEKVRPGHPRILCGRFAPGRNFYPEFFTAEDFNAWVATLDPAAAVAAQSDFTAIRKGPDGTLRSVPYAEAFHDKLVPLAEAMRKAADDVPGTTLASFLKARADALEKTNDFEESEGQWIALNGPDDQSGGHLDITIGPYENYADELMKRKAAFQLYVGVLRPSKTRQLAFYEQQIHRMDDYLWELYQRYVREEREVAPGKKLAGGPLPPRWSKPGARVTLVAVDLAYSAGYGNEGYQSLAYNLPNIAAWQTRFGSKKVMMMNMLDGKFQHILKPIAGVVMTPGELPYVDQDLFSDNTVRHELSHGIGPSGITVNGQPTTVRERHQKYYSPFEEAKAEIVSQLFGFWLAGQGLIQDPTFTRKMAATYTASTFRTVRFGTTSDHARGKVFEFNRLVQNGAILVKDGRFAVNPAHFAEAVEKLAMEVIDMQMRGSKDDARTLLEAVGNAPPALTSALDAVNARGIPVDLRVRYTFGDNWGVITDS